MKLKLKQLFFAAAILVSSLTALSPAMVKAVDCDTNPKDGVITTPEAIQCGACSASSSTPCNAKVAPRTITDLAKQVINLISLFAGIVAVVMIIVGGFRYITSAGNPESTKSAKNTILYAAVGLVVIASAQLIVHFVLNATDTTCTKGQTALGQPCK
ncbi:MAG TPA: pilin [Candidatus Babeliales bacterium]|nr:pilin [Candidatus Babeliales bacterium]